MLKKTMGMKLLVSLLIREPKDMRDVENYQDRIYRQFVSTYHKCNYTAL